MAALATLGLGGDGDEVDAIGRVEARFAITFDIADCERFVTVGDVWRALLEAFGLGEAEAAPLWTGFVDALGYETLVGDELAQVGMETRLLI